MRHISKLTTMNWLQLIYVTMVENPRKQFWSFISKFKIKVFVNILQSTTNFCKTLFDLWQFSRSQVVVMYN